MFRRQAAVVHLKVGTMEKPQQKLKNMRSNIEKNSNNIAILDGEKRKRIDFTTIDEDYVDKGSPTEGGAKLKQSELHQIIGCLFCNGETALANKLVITSESHEARELYLFAVNTKEPFSILAKTYKIIGKQRSEVSRQKLVAMLLPTVKKIAQMYNTWFGAKGEKYSTMFSPNDIRQVADLLVSNFEDNSSVKVVGGKIPGVKDGTGPHGMGHSKGRKKDEPCPIEEDDESDSTYEVTNSK